MYIKGCVVFQMGANGDVQRRMVMYRGVWSCIELYGDGVNNNKLYLHDHTCTYSIAKATLREKQKN